MKIQITLVASFLLSLHSLVTAEPAVKADFSTATLPETWTGLKGDWKVVEGALVGAELESDEHAAILSIPDVHKDSTIRFRFRMDGAKGFHLSYNHPKGHLFRVTLVGDVLTLAMDKDKKDPASKAEVLGKETLTLKPGEWTEMSCAVTGDTAKVTCGGKTLSGTHANLAKEKTGYRFVVMGASVGFDDVAFTSTK